MNYDSFTPSWYSTFLETIPTEHTAVEVGLIKRYLPQADFPEILDIACGPGRHATLLSDVGYRVYGIDKDEAAITSANAKAISNARFAALDMRDISKIDMVFDGAVNLWHSFGYYDESTNAAIIGSVSAALRQKGRAIFDIYNRDHMRSLPIEESHDRNGSRIKTLRTWNGNRMRCEIRYEATTADVLDWYLYDPDEFATVATSNGFVEVSRCAWFDESIAPSAEHARMQFVLQKR